MKLMVTLVPSDQQKCKTFALKSAQENCKKIIEINDNDEACDFRTWFIETKDEKSTPLAFELTATKNNLPYSATLKVVPQKVRLDEFNHQELQRISKSRRNKSGAAILEDIFKLKQCLKDNNLISEEFIYVGELK